jgi:PHD/YefM family antitoxin component YafN of YafNO toxin-antitoxin module
MKNQLDKIIYFVKNTGDKVIVLKDDSEFVVIPLDDYESLFRHKKQLAGLTEEEMLSRINREIALWRESQKICTDESDFPEDNQDNVDDYFPSSRLKDDDFYYNHLDEVSDDDPWVESDWLEDEEGEEAFDDFDPEDEEDWDLPPDLFSESDKEPWENKKGADDVSLPLPEEKFTEESPVVNPKEESTPIRPEVQEQPVIMPKKKVNNFGYPNPADTTGSQERGYGDDYNHIPPPPSR